MSHQVEVVELMKIKSLQEYLEEIRLEREKEAATSSRSLEDVQRLESPGKAEKLKKSSRLAALPSVFYREGRKKQDRLNLNLKTFDEGSSSELPSSQPIIVQDEEISQL